ncbi:MAG: ZIP family metal transporter [Pseudomonadota bacterium]|jgi:zinc transporter, ZIP family|uniref:ZIP family metal transporter n=1 Tax=Actibacterium sp. TaxID=1872125 RepID=UPI00050E0FE7|nr:ZIP family metal transporter [Actibacterium sp.]KGB83543.1 protein gufA [Rhodovulum sp. NI22]MDY6858227.1 ZIP family metal transporter [Pseudomonadota bacterium]|tara:strand:- start:487 stop:1260 length:774 start_codon:yes stop_codon:yes gene_type:complete
MNIVTMGLLASLAAGMMTAVGALPVLLGQSVSRRANDAMLGFAAGVMLSASFFSLILPGIDAAEAMYGSVVIAALISGAGIGLGALVVAGLNETLPHEHFFQGHEGADAGALAKIWLFVLAITIHNFPEGMAVGVGFGGGDVANGISLATGIGLQNAPEGLAVAVALRGQGYSRRRSFLVALATGLVEPVGGLLGAAAVSLSAVLLPWGLAFAAGAMIYIISHEIIPETHRHGHQNAATAGLTVGLILMLLLDVILG